ncbi:MAG TPA: alpha/beta hydrolase-fold protein [Gaiellaceae bacterium]|jgi:enterochelin esterase-like enzyme|nr:alpha/beta hydrolase-fold protein [Gaiellaceae bacterium]
MSTSVLPVPRRGWVAAAALAAFVAVGLVGMYRYVDNYWVYRGFAPPHDAAFVKVHGSATQFTLASPALGGRRQLVDMYLPPGYYSHPTRRYPVVYLLHGVPGRPAAFLATVRMGVVEDELVALHRARPMILVMPFGSTGSFTDEEWANGVHPDDAWETFLARDVVHAVDARYRTIRSGQSRVIAGLSEGGYGALNIAIHHPGEFRVVESWSGYEQADPVFSVFGHDEALMKRNSPQLTVGAAARTLKKAHTYFWLYSGTGDRELNQNNTFARTLTELHLPYRYTVVHGGHNWAIWRGHAAAAYLAASKGLAHA